MNLIDTNLVNEYNNYRNNFITDFKFFMNKMMKSDKITKFSLKKFVSKVSFVPINIKEEGAFITLGKHVFGKRKDQFSFIGGGTSCDEDTWNLKKDHEKMIVIGIKKLYN